MRNLKRVLALALALVMVIGMMVIGASAATAPNYSDAIGIVNGLNVMVGNEKGDFMDKQVLTREQAAKILAYIMLGEDNAEKLGANAQIFVDVPADKWSAGYIAYCSNVGLIDGCGDGTFAPEAPLTGVAFAKLLLGAAGYDAKYEGYVNTDEWAMNIAADAMANGIDLKGVPMSGLLTREQAAQMIVNALDMGLITYIKGDVIGTIGSFPVTYYSSVADKYYGGDLLKAEGFAKAGAYSVWMDPYAYIYYLDFEVDKEWNPAEDGMVYSVIEEADFTFAEPKTECDIASGLGLKANAKYAVYLNGASAGDETIETLKRNATFGEQGRLTKIYNDKNDMVIVQVDTYIAKVSNVWGAKYDLAGHQSKAAGYELTIYNPDKDVKVTYTGECPYAKNTYLNVNVLGDVAAATTKTVLVNGKISGEKVTVDGIIFDEAGNEVGILGTNGVEYLYNCTCGESYIKDTDVIGSTYMVYTDDFGNILYLVAVTDKEALGAGFGVITGAEAERVALGKYVVVVEVLTASGKTEQVKVVNHTGTEYFKSMSAAEQYAEGVLSWGRELISYTELKEIPAYTIALAKVDGEQTLVEAGVVETLEDVKVSDNTVFFIAEYTYKNSKKEYVFTGYNIVKGFKNIDDLGITAGKIDGVNASDLEVTYLAADKYGYTNAVLVLNSNLQTTPEKTKVANYAYLLVDTKFVTVTDDAHIYNNVIINGVEGKKLAITNAAYTGIEATGLYTYTLTNANKADTVAKVPYFEAANGAGYFITTYGVLEDDLNNEYYTIADDCEFFVVNDLTGDVYELTLDEIKSDAFYKCDMYAQYDEYGYINVMYFAENEA